jgi:hypothetical protein
MRRRVACLAKWESSGGALQLSGGAGYTFVNVVNHPDQPPPEMLQMVRAHGFLTMDISDEPLRQRLPGRKRAG